jgi:hypothetical protein
MRRLLVLLVAMTLVVAACSDDVADSTAGVDAADLTGVWRTPDGFYLVMSDDGTYRAMVKPPGEEANDEFEWGTYTVTDSTLVFTVADDAVLFTKCKERDANGDWIGIVGTYDIEAIADDGQTWTTVLVDDACSAANARGYTGQFTKHDS